MFGHFCRRASAAWRSAHRWIGFLPVAGFGALLTGCGSAAAPPVAVHPADPAAPTRPAAYRGVIGPYASQRPGDPSEWRRSNERVAPQEKP